MKIGVLTSVALAGLALGSTGCLVLSIPTSESKGLRGARIQDQEIARIEIGVTTQEGVWHQLGDPRVIWEDQRLWAYDWDVRTMEIIWLIAAAAPSGGSGAAGGSINVGRHYVLLVQFDERAVVQRIGKTVRGAHEGYGKHLIEWWSAIGPSTAGVLLAALRREPTALALLQIVPEAKDEDVAKAMHHWLWGQRALLGVAGLASAVGTFDTGGIPRPASWNKVTTREPESGWYTVRPPSGISYLGLAPASTLSASADQAYPLVVRLEIPNHTPLVYVGTLRLPLVLEREGGAAKVTGIVVGQARIEDASAQARDVGRVLGANRGEPATSLMQLHQGPFLIRTPPSGRTAANAGLSGEGER